jgi:hypothetical protein
MNRLAPCLFVVLLAAACSACGVFGLCANERVSGIEFGVYAAKDGAGAAVPPMVADE